MTVFWIIAACLLGGALLLMLPPLLGPRGDNPGAPSRAATNLAVHRDRLREAERDHALGLLGAGRLAEVRAEIERAVLQDTAAAPPADARPARRTALALAFALPLASVLAYLALGRPDAIGTPTPATPVSADARHATSPEQIQRMVASLAERLKTAPDNADGWVMLARSYTVLGRYRDAATAFRRAHELRPGNAGVLADYADVLGMAQGKRLAGEPARLVQMALDADPRHVKALALAGSVAFEARDYPAARAYWRRLLDVVPADSDIARSVQGSIAEAAQLEGGPERATASAVAAPVASGPSTDATAGVSGVVRLAPALVARVRAGDTLYVFARAAQGPRMPLAILKRPVGDWPIAFALDDTMAMSPGARLSQATAVVVGARVSRSGNATPQPGDLVGSGAVVAPGARGVEVVIDRLQP